MTPQRTWRRESGGLRRPLPFELAAFDESFDELEDLAPLGGGELLDLTELSPEADVFGRVGLGLAAGPLETEDLFGGRAEDFGQAQEHGGGRNPVVTLVVRDHSLRAADGLGELALGESLGLAQLPEPLSQGLLPPGLLLRRHLPKASESSVGAVLRRRPLVPARLLRKSIHKRIFLVTSRAADFSLTSWRLPS